MQRSMLTALIVSLFAMPVWAQTNKAIEIVPDDALGFLLFKDFRQVYAKAEDLAEKANVKSTFAQLELFLSKDIKKGLSEKGSAVLIMLHGKDEMATPRAILAVSADDPASLMRALDVNEDAKDGISTGFIDLPILAAFGPEPKELPLGAKNADGTKMPILAAKRNGFVLLTTFDARDQLQHVLSAKNNIVTKVQPARAWLDEQDVCGVCTPAGINVALPWMPANLVNQWLVNEVKKNVVLIAFAVRIEKEGDTRLLTRSYFDDDSPYSKGLGKAESVQSTPFSSLADDRYLLAALARISPTANFERLIAGQLHPKLSDAKAKELTNDSMHLLRRISDVGLSVCAKPKAENENKDATNAASVAVLKVDDAAAFIKDTTDLIKKYCEATNAISDTQTDAKFNQMGVAQPSVVITVTAKKNAEPTSRSDIVIMSVIDPKTLLVGTLSKADQAGQFVKEHTLKKPAQSLEANGFLTKTFTLMPKQTQLATFINVKNVLESVGVTLRDCSPLGFGVSMLPGSIEAQWIVPFDALQALVEAAKTQANPPLLHRDLPVSNRNAKARQATQQFWDAFHANDYKKVDGVIADLKSAWNADPRDPIVTRLLGASHGWKFMERGRDNRKAGAVMKNGILCLEFLDTAANLDPKNRVIPAIQECGMVAKALMSGGNKTLLDKSFEQLRRNTRSDPNIHGFVQGWVFSSMLDPSDRRYQEGIDAFFATLDSASGFPVPRRFPASGPLINTWLAFRARHDSACYNNDVAPHNLEGTYLGLGDAYLKQGKIAEARRSYQSVKESPNYRTWKYKNVVETRLANLEKFEKIFLTQTGQLDVAEPAMFFQSSFACTACHSK